MTRRVLILAVFTFFNGVTLLLSAPQNQAPPGDGGGQNPPSPQPAPQPQPQPRQPTPTPQPTFPSPSQAVNVRGRIITGGQFPDALITEVRFESDGGQPIGFAYANSGGEFTFQQSNVNLDQNIYVVVNMDGFKPYRERIYGGFGMNGFDGFITIFLERESTVTIRTGGGVVDLKQLRARIPGKAVDEYEKAMKESSKGNRDKAVEGLLRAVKLAPDFYEAQHTLGIQYMALHKFDDAENALLRAKDLSPKAAEPLINLGTLYYQRGETETDAGDKDKADATFDKAADVLEEALRRNPLAASAHSYLGAALYKLGSLEEAETSLKRAIDLDADQSNARLMLVNVYTRAGRYPEALEQVNAFIAKNPKAPQRAALENIKQQIEKAIAR
jgi:tetratricopeptide (TPR) repeat protein